MRFPRATRPDELGLLLPASGEGGGDPQAAWWWGPFARCANDRGQGRQTVAAMYLGDRAEPRFHPDSYGYRPGRSAHDALEVCRQRCWKFDWTIDLDVQKFFDEVPRDLIVKAVEAVTDCRWVLLYVKRWLAAPLQYPDGILVERDKGTPQGSAVSPILRNLFMHYVFDSWMSSELSGMSVRALCRRCCRALQAQAASRVRGSRDHRADGAGGPRPHPDKTHVVYCKDADVRNEC